jgi:hypothetical protein
VGWPTPVPLLSKLLSSLNTCGLENRRYWANFPNKSLICQNLAPGAPAAVKSPHGRRTAGKTP